MHILISGMFWAQPNVGSGQYLHGLLAELTRATPQHHYTLLLPAFQSQPAPPINPRIAQIVLPTPFDHRNTNLAKLWFEQIGVPLAATRLHADLIHIPYFAPPLLTPVPAVVTILDIVPLLLPEYRGRAAVRAYMRLVARAARQARHVIAISSYSRTDIIKHLGLDPTLVTTIPLAAGPQYHPHDPAQAAEYVAARYGVHGPFIYYVGGLDARKNLVTLVRAFGRMRRSGGPPATLAIAGRALGDDPLLFPDLDAMIAAEGIAPWVRRIDVPHEDNPLLYSAATVFAYPSRYEGFGLPPLEALACGTPTIVAQASSLPEVVGDAALCAAPADISGWATAAWRVLADPVLRAQMRMRGLERAAEFSYRRVAAETLAVYQTALEP